MRGVWWGGGLGGGFLGWRGGGRLSVVGVSMSLSCVLWRGGGGK